MSTGDFFITDQSIPDAHQFAKSVALGDTDFEILRQRADGLVAGVSTADGQSVVVKMWKRPGPRGWYRRLTRTGNLDREWTILHRLYARGLPVPQPIARCRFRRPLNGYTDAILIEDLGRWPRAIDQVRKMLDSGDETVYRTFETGLLELTSDVLEAGVVDEDHHLVNILVRPTGDVARIDFEIAARARFPSLHSAQLAEMLANLLSSYLFAVQPRFELADEFAHRLDARLELSESTRRKIVPLVERSVEKQRKLHGIDSRWKVPW